MDSEWMPFHVLKGKYEGDKRRCFFWHFFAESAGILNFDGPLPGVKTFF